MSSTPKESKPSDKPAHAAVEHKEQSKPDSKPAEHAEPRAERPEPLPTLSPPAPPKALELNQGRVHPEGHEPPVHELQKTRLHMDQIDAVATPQGVVLFALTEGGEIWQLTTPGGQPVWHQILTPEAPAEDA